jgi:hypothetical protein
VKLAMGVRMKAKWQPHVPTGPGEGEAVLVGGGRPSGLGGEED